MKVWFITGTSKGFGRVWAEAALERGDKVVATARRAETLDGLVQKYGGAVLPIALDVTDKAAVDAAVRQGQERFGRLDVVVNNAGYGQFGTVEELSEAEVRDQIETNLFAQQRDPAILLEFGGVVRPGNLAVELVRVELHSDSDLSEIARALGPFRGDFRRGEDGKQNPGEDRDDGHDDQELDQREAATRQAPAASCRLVLDGEWHRL